jgi:quercetin dioxygenase-like cupin family protein
LGDLVIRKASSEHTGEACSLFEAVVQPQGGPPSHIQHVGGLVLLRAGGRVRVPRQQQHHESGRGVVLYVPKGNLHTFKNVGTGIGRVLVSQAPGGLHERFYEEIGKEAQDLTTPRFMEGPPDVERIVVIVAKYGIEIPPPPA